MLGNKVPRLREREAISLSPPQLLEAFRLANCRQDTGNVAAKGEKTAEDVGFRKRPRQINEPVDYAMISCDGMSRAVIGLLAASHLRFRFHNQSRLPRRLVPNTFAGV